ncbi:hypothetical protein [Paenibacillus sp.]|uniref:hypothetical protein n=1 Tax=Paenibacillus sp. TaxID=58172 RepID=UPI002811753B|nr:hypothetical protein [Paenibacillus sp.]
MGKIANGYMLIFVSYIMCFYLAGTVSIFISGVPLDRSRTMGVIVGIVMLTLPYVLSGLYSTHAWKERKYALWFILSLMLAERAGILLIGALFVAGGGDGGGDKVVNMENIIDFVGSEALPYFSWGYSLLGPISLIVGMFSTHLYRFVHPLIKETEVS